MEQDTNTMPGAAPAPLPPQPVSPAPPLVSVQPTPPLISTQPVPLPNSGSTPPTPKKSKKILIRLFPPLLITLAAFAIYFFVDFTAVSDWFRARDFQPTTSMEQIISDLPLTDRGLLIFQASHPTLKANPEFSSTCGGDQDGTSILGCFTNGDIFIKNITDPELAGILQSTAAHELLHAIWARLDDSTRANLAKELDSFYRENQSTLSSRLVNYEESRWHEELHSIFGTEFTNLPAPLADHYVRFFSNQAKIVAFFDAYNSKFQTLRAESEVLRTQIDQLKIKIDAETTNYEDGSDEINTAITDFHRRVENGSFDSDIAAAYREQAELQRRSDVLTDLFSQINRQIDEVNILIEKYNANSATLNDLTNSITSPTAPPTV